MRLTIDKAAGEARYAKTLSEGIDGLAVTQTNLRRLLTSIDNVGWSTHEESGRIDRRAFVRYATGSANIFSRRTVKEAENTAVSILLDCSGSMSNEIGTSSRISIARKIITHLGNILHKAKVPFAITGFNGYHAKAGQTEVKGIDGDNYFHQTPAFIPIKRWKQSLQSAAVVIGSLDELAHGNTPDYSSLYASIEELSLRPEHKRILFFITDAVGYKVDHMKHLQKLADKLDVKIVAIGIGSTDAIKCFTNAANVDTANDFTSAAFNNVLKAVKQ